MQWEADFLYWLEQFRSPFMNHVWWFISYVCLVFFFIPIIYFLVKKDTRWKAICALLCLVVAWFSCAVALKAIINRPRPYETYTYLTPVVYPIDASFPSGHTLYSFTLAMMYYKLFDKKFGTLSLVMAFLVSWSRMAMGLHYPSDILGGFLFALLWVWIFNKWFVPWMKKKY